ncbi:MAG TPA: hypothetical protein VH518_20670 [Tepidisphaeraceae bacterium]|jgi:hypothetical protein
MRRFIFVACVISILGIGGVNTTSAADVSARRALNTVLPDLRFDNISIGDAVEFLRDVSGANIHVNWKALEEAGVGKDATVNVRLRGVSLRKILGMVLNEAGAGNLLTYYIDDNVIEVTTRALADQQLITRLYPVDDLIMDVPDFIGPDFQLSGTSSTGGGGGGGSQLFSGTSNDQQGSMSTRAERAQALIDTIQTIIQPEIWNTNGGPAAIRFWNGSLIVTAPRSVHEALGGFVD